MGHPAAVDPTNPQSWNRYAYVANNPLSFVDPSGLVYLYAEPPGGDAARNAFLYNHFLGDAGDGAGGGFGFSLNGFFNGLCNDFMPCGAAPTSLGQVFQSVWSDALGLPTNLNCPVVGGLSNYLCGGVSPIMDAENARPCTPADYEKDAGAQTNAIYHAQETFVNTSFTKWWQGSSTPIIWGCLKGGALGCIAGLDFAILAQPGIIPGAMIWGSYAAYKEAFTNPTNYAPLNCRP